MYHFFLSVSAQNMINIDLECPSPYQLCDLEHKLRTHNYQKKSRFFARPAITFLG